MLGFGYGSIHFLNQEYQEIHRLTLSDENLNFKSALGPRFPSYIDIHEDAITNRGSVMLTANNATRADLRSVGGLNMAGSMIVNSMKLTLLAIKCFSAGVRWII